MATKRDTQTSSTDPVQEASDKGYIGQVSDTRPNSDYTVAGSIARQGEDSSEPEQPADNPQE